MAYVPSVESDFNDPRPITNKVTKAKFQCGDETGVTEAFSSWKKIYGMLKGIKLHADNITGTDYTIELLDQDGQVWYIDTNVSDDSYTITNLDTDDMFIVCGMYRVRWSALTSGDLDAGDLEAIFFME